MRNDFYRWVEAHPDHFLHPTARGWDMELGYSTEISSGMFFGGGGVVTTAMQIAVYMGARRLFIWGMDMNYDGPQEHVYKEEEHEQVPAPQGFETHIVPAFELVRDVCGSLGVELFNVCPESRLSAEIIPKYSIQQVREILETKAS